ncbi:hypothetical protein [Desulfoplanes sp.]
MRIIVILILLLLVAVFLKPSKLKKFFLVYGVSIGIIGLLVYGGNKYLHTRAASTIAPSQIALEGFRLDTTLQLFLKGKIVNHAPRETVKELTLRLTVYRQPEETNGTGILGTQEFTVVARIHPGEHKNIIQKVSIPGLEPEKSPRWDLGVLSVKTALW